MERTLGENGQTCLLQFLKANKIDRGGALFACVLSDPPYGVLPFSVENPVAQSEPLLCRIVGESHNDHTVQQRKWKRTTR